MVINQTDGGNTVHTIVLVMFYGPSLNSSPDIKFLTRRLISPGDCGSTVMALNNVGWEYLLPPKEIFYF